MKLTVLTCALLLDAVHSCVVSPENQWQSDARTWIPTEKTEQSQKMNHFGSAFDVPVLNTPPAVSKRKIASSREGPRLGRGVRTPKSFSVDTETVKANEHLLSMTSKTVCALPRGTVVCVKNFYPDAQVEYQPPCTILHRCDPGSGCCSNPSHSCQSYTTERVTLHFRSSRGSLTEKLHFANHTSCHCKVREDFPVHEDLSSLQRKHFRPSEHKLRQFYDYGDDDNDDHDNEEEEDSEDAIGCPKCPQPFNKRLKNRICRCDCFEDDNHCLKVKQGHIALTEEQRRCVHRKKCRKPTCAHGRKYDVDFGKCKRTDLGLDDEDAEDEESMQLHDSLNEAEVDDDESDSE